MKPASTALQALLASRSFWVADLYTFTLVDGTVLRYCGGDQGVTAGGNFFPAGAETGPYFDRTGSRAKCHWKRGLEVDTLAFDVLPGSSTVEGLPFLTAVRQGVFDGAEVQLERAFMPSFGDTSAGTVVLFVGRVAEVLAGRTLATFTINSHLELLNQNLPRNLYQAGCVNTLYDGACGLSRAAFQVSGTASAGSTANVVLATLANPTGDFDHGSLTFTSGVNAGLSRTVSAYAQGSPGTLALMMTFPAAPAAGDTFTVVPGCDKAMATCQNRFANLANFRGFPFVPENSTAV